MRVLTATLAVAWMLGCGHERCDPEMVLEDGACLIEGALVSPEPLEGPDDASLGFGTACLDDDACADFEADFCMISPFDEVGYCSVQGCEPEGDDCPIGYSCMDLSVFDASLQPACARQ